MESRTLENVADAAINLGHLRHEVSKAKVVLDDVLEDGKRKAGRILKRGVLTVEDCVEDSTYFIKRHPWQSVGAVLGLGAGLGFLGGWMATRTYQKNQHN